MDSKESAPYSESAYQFILDGHIAYSLNIFKASQSYFFPRVLLVGGPITSEIQDWILIEMSALGLLSATKRHDDAHTAQ